MCDLSICILEVHRSAKFVLHFHTSQQTCEIFARNHFRELLMTLSVKRRTCHDKKSQLGHELPTLDFAISRAFFFAKFRENKSVAKISKLTVDVPF